jgi:hypothetical protein
LRDDNVVTDPDVLHVVDPGALSDPTVIPDTKAPWVLDVDPRLYEHVRSDPRAKKTQDAALKSVRRDEGVSQDRGFKN